MTARPRLLPATALLLAAIALLTSALAAAQPAERRPERGQTPPPATETPLPADVVTTHTLKLAGGELAYTATAGTLTLANEKGEHTAEIFYVAYTKSGVAPGSRPIPFAFNGGGLRRDRPHSPA